jgi:uncharacterized protein (TIGR02453 family)
MNEISGSGFKGFSPDVPKFFSELKENNNKDWFSEHKVFYEKNIKETAKSFIASMGERFARLDLPFIADPKKSVFRINRDIRFSSNKDPYKTNLGIIFPYTFSQANKMPVQSIGLYYHLEHDGSFIAGGIHMPETPVLRLIRNNIASNWDEFKKIVNDKNLKREFEGSFYGESLKRMPQGFPADHPAGDYLKLKEFTVFSNIPIDASFSSGILDIIEKKAVAAVPFFNFLIEAL